MNMMEEIKKPLWMPPDWIFRPVWIVLYTLIAIAAIRIFLKKKQGKNIKKGSILFFIQLALNFLWPYMFFKLQLIGASFIELCVLLIFVILTVMEFFRIDKWAGYLMIPYGLWVAFATVINGAIWYMNM